MVSLPSSPLNEEFEKLVKENLEKWHIPGLAIGVVDGDETFTEVCSLFYCVRRRAGGKQGERERLDEDLLFRAMVLLNSPIPPSLLQHYSLEVCSHPKEKSY